MSEQNIANKFLGLWSLRAIEQQNPETGEWKEWETKIQGQFLYDQEGNMSVHITTVGYEDINLKFQNFNTSMPIEALKIIWR